MKIETDLDFLSAVGQVVIQYRSHVGKLQDKLAIQAEKLTYVNDVLQPEMEALKAENKELKNKSQMLNWSGWTDEPYPSTTCKHIELSAKVQIVAPTEENGERCRYWEVKCFGNVIASGYTMMSAAAQYLCETIMENEGKEKAYEIMRMSMNKPNPRVA